MLISEGELLTIRNGLTIIAVMVKRYLMLISALCLSLAGEAQQSFDSLFEKKSLRIDFSLSGNAQFQAAAIEQLREEPVWGGPLNNLIDQFYYGGYYINVYSKNDNQLI